MNEAQDKPVSAEDIAEVITQFEQYRERLINDTVENAKKAKISKKVVMEQLQPQLDDIDGKLEALRNQYNSMTNA